MGNESRFALIISAAISLAGCGAGGDESVVGQEAEPKAEQTSKALANSCGRMNPGEVLGMGQNIWSCNGLYRLSMQTDGHLVFYGPSGVIWASGTYHGFNETYCDVYYFNNQEQQDCSWREGRALAMQGDGNLVLVGDRLHNWGPWSAPPTDATRGSALMHTGTYGNPGAFFAVQPDGNLVVYTAGGVARWWRGLGWRNIP